MCHSDCAKVSETSGHFGKFRRESFHMGGTFLEQGGHADDFVRHPSYTKMRYHLVKAKKAAKKQPAPSGSKTQSTTTGSQKPPAPSGPQGQPAPTGSQKQSTHAGTSTSKTSTNGTNAWTDRKPAKGWEVQVSGPVVSDCMGLRVY